MRTDDPAGKSCQELIALLELALRYISHPDVQAIPFALPASTVQERIEEALAAIK